MEIEMKLNITSLEEVPEEVRGEYEKAADGVGFTLKLEGDVVPKEQLVTFRNTNIKLLKDKARLESEVARFAGIDPEKYAVAVQELEQFKKNAKVEDPADVAARIRDEVAKAVNPIKQQLTEETEKRTKTERQLAFRDAETKLRDVAVKIGIAEHAVPDFLNRALETFDLDGVARTPDGETIYSKERVQDPLTPEEWGKSLVTVAPHLFKTNTGGGTRNGAPGAGGKKVIDGNDLLAFGNNLEGIAKGTVVTEASVK